VILDDGAPKKSALDWISYNEAIATVDQNGTVKGVGRGTVEIRCSLRDNPDIKAFITVQVVIPVKKITSGVGKKVLFSNQKAAWKPQIEPKEATIQILSYASDNTDIAIVNEKGEVTAVSPGKARIKASSTDESDKTCTLELYVEPSNPVDIEDLAFKPESSGKMEFTVLNNCQSMTLMNIMADVYLYDANNNQIKSQQLKLDKKISIPPTKKQKIKMNIPDNPKAKKYKIVVSGIVLSDGTEYTIPEKYRKVWRFMK